MEKIKEEGEYKEEEESKEGYIRDTNFKRRKNNADCQRENPKQELVKRSEEGGVEVIQRGECKENRLRYQSKRDTN